MRRIVVSTAVIFGSLLTTGCGAAAFTPPERGGHAWVEGRSAHFILQSDLPPEEAREALLALERSYTRLADIAFPSTRSPPRTRVIHFRRRTEYELVAPAQTAGFFTPGLHIDEATEPVAVTVGDFSDEPLRRIFQHELTHRFVSYYYPKARAWLNEGLAEYFETMTVENGYVVLGLPSYPLGAERQAGSLRVAVNDVPTVSEVFAMEGPSFLASSDETSPEDARTQMMRNRAGAWALVHLLKNGPERYREQFDRVLSELQQGWEGPAGDGFSSLDPKLFEEDFREWLVSFTQGGSIIRRARYEDKPGSIERFVSMSPVDVHLLWAALRPALAEQEVDAALAFEPKAWKPRLLRARLREREGNWIAAERDLNDALSESDDETRCLLALLGHHARRVRDPIAEHRARDSAERLLPDVIARAKTVSEQNALATSLALLGRNDDALRFAQQAIADDPACFRCYETLALVHARRGELRDAVTAQSLAIERLPHGTSIKQAFRELAGYESLNKHRASQRRKLPAEEPSPSAGPLTPEVMQKVIRAKFERFRACYEDGLWVNAELRGRVTLRFTIGLDGRASEVIAKELEPMSAEEKARPVLTDPAVRRCMVGVASSLVFPPPRDGVVTVAYPIVFSP